MLSREQNSSIYLLVELFNFCEGGTDFFFNSKGHHEDRMHRIREGKALFAKGQVVNISGFADHMPKQPQNM